MMTPYWLLFSVDFDGKFKPVGQLTIQLVTCLCNQGSTVVLA